LRVWRISKLRPLQSVQVAKGRLWTSFPHSTPPARRTGAERRGSLAPQLDHHMRHLVEELDHRRTAARRLDPHLDTSGLIGPRRGDARSFRPPIQGNGSVVELRRRTCDRISGPGATKTLAKRTIRRPVGSLVFRVFRTTDVLNLRAARRFFAPRRACPGGGMILHYVEKNSTSRAPAELVSAEPIMGSAETSSAGAVRGGTFELVQNHRSAGTSPAGARVEPFAPSHWDIGAMPRKCRGVGGGAPIAAKRRRATFGCGRRPRWVFRGR
jgi:hypothetical protein